MRVCVCASSFTRDPAFIFSLTRMSTLDAISNEAEMNLEIDRAGNASAEGAWRTKNVF
jgi:hypothetical protein